MKLQTAKKIKIGDSVTFKLVHGRKTVKVLDIITEHSDPKTKVPLFQVDLGLLGTYTYLFFKENDND